MSRSRCRVCREDPCRGELLGCRTPHIAVRGDRPVVDVDTVIRAVCQHYRLRKSQLMQRSRERQYVTARAVAIYLARVYTEASYLELGRAFGARHHSTMIAAHDRVQNAMARPGPDRQGVHAVEAILLGREPARPNIDAVDASDANPLPDNPEA